MIVFILFLSLVMLGVLTAALALARSRRRRLEVDQRLGLLAFTMGRPEGGSALASASQARAKRANAYLGRILLLDTVHPWTLEPNTGSALLTSAVAAFSVWLLCRFFMGASSAVALPAGALASFFAARTLLIKERGRIEAAFAALFPDAVDTVARMLRAGLPVTSAFHTVGKEAPAPANVVFATLADQMKIGIPIAEALQLSSQQIRVPDFRFFAAAVLLQQSTGGNLAATLEVLSQIMRKRRAIQAKARAATAEVRFTAYVLGALPVLTIAALFAVSPDYLTPLFTDPRGHLILGLAGGGLLLSFLTMRAMMRSVELK
jgi:tight adherence protein B